MGHVGLSNLNWKLVILLKFEHLRWFYKMGICPNCYMLMLFHGCIDFIIVHFLVFCSKSTEEGYCKQPWWKACGNIAWHRFKRARYIVSWLTILQGCRLLSRIAYAFLYLECFDWIFYLNFSCFEFLLLALLSFCLYLKFLLIDVWSLCSHFQIVLVWYS